MSDLILPLKKKWFDMWKSGEKPEDYRVINSYWAVRFCQNHSYDRCYHHFDGEVRCAQCVDGFKPKKYDRLILTCGYPKKTDSDKRLVIENPPTISIGTGKPEWGAKENEDYFKVSRI